LFVGVGIDAYEHFDDLDRAVEEVEMIGALLAAKRGFVPSLHREVTDGQAVDGLTEALGPAELAGGALVVLWAGHGELSEEGPLRLITSRVRPRVTPTSTAEWVASLATRTGANQVLLVFDTCYSGRAIDAAAVVSRLMANLPDPKPAWVGILASAQEYQKARDGVFFGELLRVLSEGPRDPILRLRFNAFNEGVRGDDVIDAVVQEWTATAHVPAPLALGRPGVLLPNPLYDPDAPEQVVEHLLLAAQGRGQDEEGSFFTGRETQLAEIVCWMDQPEPGVMVVTGPPGSGKSAIVGRIVSLSNPRQRESLGLGGAVEHDPGEGSVHAHVHARRLTADRVAEEIDTQLIRRDLIPQATSRRNQYELLGALARLAEPITIVIDGLDEAEQEAWSIAEGLIRGLGQFARILVGTREVEHDGKSLVATLATVPAIDLGDPRWADQTVADVREYVARRLAGLDSVPDLMDPRRVADHLQRSVADDEGLFLLARVVTSQLRSAPVATIELGWEQALASSVEDAFERDLAKIGAIPRGGVAGPVAARELLTALAWGFGTGMPDDVWAAFAAALSGTGTAYAVTDVYWVLGAAGRWVVGADGGGRAAYRLSHQRLVQHLRPPRRITDRLEGDTSSVAVAGAIKRLFDDVVTAGEDPVEHRYLWLHSWRHGVEAGLPGLAAVRAIAATNPAFVPDLASALNNLGILYSEVGRRGEAVPVTEEAMAIYRDLAATNPAFVPALASALNNLGSRYSEVGRAGADDSAWEAAIAALGAPAAHAELLLLRASQREKVEEAVTDLERVATLVAALDPGHQPALTGRLHATARACRAADSEEFDAAWRLSVGSLPEWLALEPAHLEVALAWVTTANFAEAANFVAEHGAALLGTATELALEEIGLLAGDEDAVSQERSILAAARELGWELAYRPYLDAEQARTYLSADIATQAGMLATHRNALLSRSVVAAMTDVLDPGRAEHVAGSALVTLAMADLDDRAMRAVASNEQFSALAAELAGLSRAQPLLALSQLYAVEAAGPNDDATAMFYAALSMALSGNAGDAVDQLRSARQTSDTTVQALVPTLIELVVKQPVLAVLAPALAEPLPTTDGPDREEE